jgi:hypothetical protein
MQTTTPKANAANQPERPGLCLPMQAVPVDRTPAGAAAHAASGAEACFDWTSLIGPATGILGSLL